MAYRCDQAVFGGLKDPIRCKVSGSVCAHQKMCMMEGRIVLTDKAMTCPGRDGRLPEEEPAKKAAAPTESAAKTQRKPAGTAKAQQKKAGAAKTQRKTTGVKQKG